MQRGTYRGQHVYITVTAPTEITDYGVPFSPKLYGPLLDEIEIERVEILEVDLDVSTLSPHLLDSILELDFTWEEIGE